MKHVYTYRHLYIYSSISVFRARSLYKLRRVKVYTALKKRQLNFKVQKIRPTNEEELTSTVCMSPCKSEPLTHFIGPCRDHAPNGGQNELI